MLVGRDRDLERLRRALRDAPVVALWGPAGVGKSALAREALPGAVECSLSACVDASSMRASLAAALGVEASGEVPLAAMIGRALHAQPGPVVIDGADLVLAPLREALGRWRERPGPLRVVVTSRERLGLDDEVSVELAPLGLEDAVVLWRRATARLGHEADDALAPRIVEGLDRLPRALEWMASQAALLGDEACLARLEAEVPGRDPLQRLLERSLASLDAPTREVLERVAAHARGAPVDQLEALREGALASVEELARRSLVRPVREPGAPARVAAFRAVRAAVLASAEAEGRLDALHRAHAEATLARVEASDRRVSPTDREELARVRERFAERDRALATRAALRLLPFDRAQGAAAEARSRLQGWLGQLEGDLAARARLALASLDRLLGDYASARAHADAVLAGSAAHRFDALIERAHLDRRQSRLDEALSGYEAAAEQARADGDRAREHVALGERGRMLQSLGRLSEAQRMHADAIALCRVEGLRGREALERSLHARATHRAGQVEEAVGLHERALALFEELGDRRHAAAERGHLGFCHHELGETEVAERLFRASIEGLAAVGDVALEHIERVLLARLLSDLDRPSEARLELAIAATLARSFELPRLELTARLVEGLVAWREGDAEAARERWEAGRALGPLFEVGFETLLGAHLALAESARGEVERARALLDASADVIGRLESPGPRHAYAVLRAAALGQAIPEVPGEVLRTSSDARRALALAGAAPGGALALAEDGRHARLPDGTEIDLRRRAAPRRILLALFEARRERPGEALSKEALIAAGWPDERMLPEAADKRLRTAVWTLRRAGLGELLMTSDDGYLLDPLVPVQSSAKRDTTGR